MKLKKLTIQNFRAYQAETEISFGNITGLIGRNDVGKTSILDALGIFFGHKLCKYEARDKCVYAEENEDVIITCEFEELPQEIILDATSVTSLEREYLLTDQRTLSLSKVFKKGKGSGVYMANCIHPSATNAKGILLKRNDELKSIAQSLGIAAEDNRSNVSLREAIYSAVGDLKLKDQFVALSKEDGKAILDQIQNHLPHFALFRADRPSTDEEAEVQDPMKVAISQAIEDISPQLEDIKDQVKQKALAVANNTLSHLADLDPEFAMSLTPNFKVDPKWEGIFKLSLSGDDDIPINKRGSGVRRLVLISFFKAEAERIKREYQERGVIYAIEEPETSQHPDKQKLLVDAFSEMADKDGCQIVITTHVPALAEQLPIKSIRHIFKNQEGDIKVNSNQDDVFKLVAKDLGVLPDSRAQVIVCVEGPNDIAFFKNLSALLLNEGLMAPDFENDPRIVLLPLGGDTLRDWVNGHYLKNIGKPEVHIYDRDDQNPPKYKETCDAVKTRGDGSIAFITSKREAENYLHPDAIQEALGISVTYTDDCDVPAIVGAALGVNDRTAKRKLNRVAAKKMTKERLDERDPNGEILGWFDEILQRCS
ncbi:DNA replication and repair protein RecF [[Synechococcus] sp. NIES-970]|nr:DNA replication and repair protein RecF [[Synechococcus] sp. NIES-970]